MYEWILYNPMHLQLASLFWGLHTASYGLRSNLPFPLSGSENRIIFLCFSLLPENMKIKTHKINFIWCFTKPCETCFLSWSEEEFEAAQEQSAQKSAWISGRWTNRIIATFYKLHKKLNLHWLLHDNKEKHNLCYRWALLNVSLSLSHTHTHTHSLSLSLSVKIAKIILGL